MPIADCGFTARVAVTGTPPTVKVTGGNELLVQKGPTAKVEIGFDASMFPGGFASITGTTPGNATPTPVAIPTPATPAPAPRVVEALIDTGACQSCIDEDLAQQLGLPLIDRRAGSGIGGTETFNVYLGHIRIVDLNFTEYGQFMGVKLTAGGQPHQALLGRSLLKSMILVYDGRDGTVRLTC